MTAGDAHLDEIQARAEQGDRSPWWEANALQDRRYLLAELRKAHEALTRVEEVADELATHSEGRALDFTDDDFDRGWHGANRAAVDQLRAAVAAANGDGKKP